MAQSRLPRLVMGTGETTIFALNVRGASIYNGEPQVGASVGLCDIFLFFPMFSPHFQTR